MLSKIIVGFDGTESSKKALEFGLDFAEKYSAAVTILNVLEIPVLGNPEVPFGASAGMASLLKDLRKTHQAMLDKAAAQAAKQKPTLNISAHLLEGNPPDQIVATAQDGSFDAIVVGHGSAGRIREMFLGGTSERVAHLARCAVIIVK